MKLSELKKQIKDNIYEILSEKDINEGTYVGPGALDALQKDPKFAAAKDKTTPINTLKAGGTVTLESEDDEKEDTWNKEDKEDKRPEDKEPSKSELAKKDSITTSANKLQKLVAKMKELAKEYVDAKGDKKEKIKDELKKLTIEKKALEKAILPPSEED